MIRASPVVSQFEGPTITVRTATITAEVTRVARSVVLTGLGKAADQISQASLGYEKEQNHDSFN